ncbi:unnamed protein product [Miscanthus lutarioriparius]|uniref:Protein FAM33A n=1 Tax=Miscanthus lutarioriparius TaxID=422564 RepID=A0A811PBW1_9POAL|nr:unnamed protein product [Miscanthus lutarioriparius]
MAADPSRRRPQHHPAVLSTLFFFHRLDLEFRAAYPDHVSIFLSTAPFLADGIRRRRLHANPAKLVARVKRVVEEAAALKEMSRDLLTQKQELIDQIRVSLMAQRRMTQRLLAASGLPPMSEEDETVHNSLNEVIQDWTAQVSPITREIEDQDKKKDANQIFSTIM